LYDYGFVSSTSESAKVNQDFSGQHLLGIYAYINSSTNGHTLLGREVSFKTQKNKNE
jgi:hypothetical protein